jgi:hypothetical protein
MKTRRTLVTVSAVVLASILGACGSDGDSAEGIGDNIDTVRSFLQTSHVALPSIAVELGPDGRVDRLGGFDARSVDDVAEALTGQPLVGRIVLIDPDYLQWFDRADIQHVSVASRPEGLYLLVNGRPMPYLAWDASTAASLVDVTARLVKEDGEGASLLGRDAHRVVEAMVPFMQALNVRFDVSLPEMDRSGRDPIPLPGPEAFSIELTQAEAESEPLQTVDLEVVYEAVNGGRDWVPSLFGFNTLDLGAVADPFEVKVPQLRLRQTIRERIEAQGIETIGFEARADGLFVAVDGELLPHLAWNEATLANLSMVLDALYPTDVALPDDADWVPVVKNTAPAFNDYSIAVVVRFPTAVER